MVEGSPLSLNGPSSLRRDGTGDCTLLQLDVGSGGNEGTDQRKNRMSQSCNRLKTSDADLAPVGDLLELGNHAVGHLAKARHLEERRRSLGVWKPHYEEYTIMSVTSRITGGKGNQRTTVLPCGRSVLDGDGVPEAVGAEGSKTTRQPAKQTSSQWAVGADAGSKMSAPA